MEHQMRPIRIETPNGLIIETEVVAHPQDGREQMKQLEGIIRAYNETEKVGE